MFELNSLPSGLYFQTECLSKIPESCDSFTFEIVAKDPEYPEEIEGIMVITVIPNPGSHELSIDWQFKDQDCARSDTRKIPMSSHITWRTKHEQDGTSIIINEDAEKAISVARDDCDFVDISDFSTAKQFYFQMDSPGKLVQFRIFKEVETAAKRSKSII